jgi:hypothetical protein
MSERKDTTSDRCDTRLISLRAATVNEEQRSVEAVLSTESAVEMYDWTTGDRIDEILLVDGVTIPRQLPLLNTHNRYSLDDVLGSVREIRQENTDGLASLVGRLLFAAGDEMAERAWNKVRQGHLTDISVGYRVAESVEVPRGQSATVSGRTFTARDRRLRVATRWDIREASVVPIGADQQAKTRDDRTKQEIRTMDEDQEIRDDSAQSAAAGEVSQEQRAEAPAAPAAPVVTETPESAAQAAISAERERARRINELAGSDVPREMVVQAINEGWTVERASLEFLGAIRGRRAAAPAIHSRSHDVDCNARSLAAGLLIATGVDPLRCRMHNGRNHPGRLDQLAEQDVDRGERFRTLSARDLIRECARLDSGRYHLDPDEAWRTAVSGGTLSYVFGTNVYAKILEGWNTVADSTVGWCDEEDVANFLTQEDITLSASARLERLGRGGTAGHASLSDARETYKIYRYARQFVVDEQDIADDRLGALMRMPMEMGLAARRIRPDLVYNLILENPTLADTGAVFNATATSTTGGHANLGTAALASDSLKDGITAIMKQRDSGSNVLDIAPRWLLVPADLGWKANELTKSAAIMKLFADSSDPMYTTRNLLAEFGLQVRVDDRIGANGVTDPDTGSNRAGSATNWFLAAGGPRSIRVAYRRGTGRVPQMRSFTLDKGQWGIGWDINMDIGAAFMDYRGWYKSTGAA